MFNLFDLTGRHDMLLDVSLAAVGEKLLSLAVTRWVVRQDPQRARLPVEEGRPLIPFALAVVPNGGSLVTIGRCYATGRAVALRQLLEEATRYDWRGTPAEHWQFYEVGKSLRRE